jgi:all-trans-8'-apo-beta-carotenal 15,15'-oxygenase
MSVKSYTQKDWQKGYQSQPYEYEYWIDEIEGTIPVELNGTLFRNGPGLLDINGQIIAHPFDGDGLICAIKFEKGKAHFQNKFVKTEGYLNEKKAGKILYRGVFGTQKSGGFLGNIFDLKLKNIANTNVIYWGGKLLALWEAAEPHSLNPDTLETIGLDYLDGILQPGDGFSAHPWIDPSSVFDNGEPCLVNFAMKPGLSTTLVTYEISPQGKLLRKRQHSVPGFAFIHDFAITPNYCIFFQNPVSYNPFPFLFGFKGAGQCVKYQPEQLTRIILIPRNPDHKEVKILETNSGFIFHYANAFEKNGKIYVDSVCYENLPEVKENTSFLETNFDELPPGQLWRFSLNLEQESVSSEMIESRCCEFPMVNPNNVGRDYRYLYIAAAHNASGNAPLQAILKLDLHTNERKLHSFANSGFVSEPIFVAKSDSNAEDEGWLLTMVYDAHYHRSNLVILDGQNLEIIATLHLKHHLPYGLHGSWMDN